MERDSLLSHGASFLLHDRLVNCSDKHVGLLTGNDLLAGGEGNKSDALVLPYVFRYLTNELAAMGVKMSLAR